MKKKKGKKRKENSGNFFSFFIIFSFYFWFCIFFFLDLCCIIPLTFITISGVEPHTFPPPPPPNFAVFDTFFNVRMCINCWGIKKEKKRKKEKKTCFLVWASYPPLNTSAPSPPLWRTENQTCDKFYIKCQFNFYIWQTHYSSISQRYKPANCVQWPCEKFDLLEWIGHENYHLQ